MKNTTTRQSACGTVSTSRREKDKIELLVVQFMHPGGEYPKSRFDVKPDGSLVKKWSESNAGSHHRSFLQCNGQYRRSMNGKIGSGLLNFWGEWEGPAIVQPLKDKSNFKPNWLLTPTYPKKNETGLNTDPFVFNGPFRYSLCQQGKKVSLQNLAAGSLILFGSCKKKNFMLDTVFVVGKDCGTVDSYSRKSPDDLFYQMTIGPVMNDPGEGQGQCGGKQNCDGTVQSIVYEGATPDAPVNGMYSFAPARLASSKDGIFARPVLDEKILGEELFKEIVSSDRRIITPNLTQGIKNTDESKVDVVEVWKTLTKKLLEQKFVLGVSFGVER